jgi:serine/threonine-protein kinase ATR
MPLNEECGLLEWVNNTVPLRSILTKLYERDKKKVFVSVSTVAFRFDPNSLPLSSLQSNAIYTDLDNARVAGPAEAARVFRVKILPQYVNFRNPRRQTLTQTILSGLHHMFSISGSLKCGPSRMLGSRREQPMRELWRSCLSLDSF